MHYSSTAYDNIDQRHQLHNTIELRSIACLLVGCAGSLAKHGVCLNNQRTTWCTAEHTAGGSRK
jgi:hypothetical protein